MQSLPAHLQKYIVTQDVHQYTAIEQSTWRYILEELKKFLSIHAHESYAEGLEKTGITLDQIPSISDISKKLEPLGWRALPVSGFIPPAAFMELQSLGVLPIASEMRTTEHLRYTPAPDIVHEAAGHAPMLANADYSAYLKDYAQVSRRAILFKEDLDIYSAIRVLSDLKETPHATPEQIQMANQELERATQAATNPSEAAQLARMNWWTAEYGLIGSLDNPKIYGAGLLSSVGESLECLKDKVKKIPLTVDCVNYSYDITEPQPQLFVTPDFSHLRVVLKEFASQMAYQTGGLGALKKALASRTINSFKLDSGLEIGSILERLIRDNEGQVCFLKFSAPTQLAYNEKELSSHNKSYHAHGYSTPIGLLEDEDTPLHLWPEEKWQQKGITVGKEALFAFDSGIKVRGNLKSKVTQNGVTLLLTLENCLVTYKDEVLFDPSWGNFDMALGTKVISVWGGAPDREAYGETEDFSSIKIEKKPLSELEQKRNSYYQQIHKWRTAEHTFPSKEELKALQENYKKEFGEDWLFDWECDRLVN